MNAQFFISIILAGISAACIVTAFVQHGQRKKAWAAGGLGMETGGKTPLLAAVTAFSGFIFTHFAFLKRLQNREQMQKKLEAAGLANRLNPELIFTVKILAALTGALAFLILFDSPLVIRALSGLISGWFYIIWWTTVRIKRRRLSIELALPGALDWLALSVEAGLDFSQALSRITHRMSNGALKDELLTFDAAVKMGTPRREALTDLAKRAQVPTLSSFIALLIQADSLGSSIGPVLRSFSTRLRSERFTRAERKGVTASQKALLPVVIFIMPATFIVIFGPIFVRLATGGFNALLNM